MPSKEVTHIVDRMEMLEERFGIRVQGLLVTADDEPDEDNLYSVEVNGEIYSLSGGPLDNALKVQLVCHNERGQVVGLDQIFLLEDFAGYEAFAVHISCKAYPSLIKVVPKSI